MKRYALVMIGFAGLLATPLLAQAPTPSVPDAIRQQYNAVKNNLLKAADKMPDDGYDFKPTPEERSFGGWVAHVADAQTGGCSRALGTPKAPQRQLENHEGRSRRRAERFLRHLRRRLRRAHRRERQRADTELSRTDAAPRRARWQRRARQRMLRLHGCLSAAQGHRPAVERASPLEAVSQIFAEC